MDINKTFTEIAEANADVFDEPCPATDTCGVHYRNQYRREGVMIDYVGDYAIITDSAPLTREELARSLAAAIMGRAYELESDDFQVEVIYVGDKPLSVLFTLTEGEAAERAAVVATFNDLAEMEAVHNTVVQEVREGKHSR